MVNKTRNQRKKGNVKEEEVLNTKEWNLDLIMLNDKRDHPSPLTSPY
jgi:hypothetical protein